MEAAHIIAAALVIGTLMVATFIIGGSVRFPEGQHLHYLGH